MEMVLLFRATKHKKDESLCEIVYNNTIWT